ncbi:phytoene/squalene synthase family protein [Nakamurella antarctica]|uniref:Phytoene/squalene synthase family protein n=1 Tax=Nakamurella antarctica TaxID=1902245 RepID=A0A3G8ZQT2_9ACTN|nr:phytoene/squalene synthase family protein [Nakamurella antarctica]AZI59165.1 phytoene/squalene synthase family protein [Nakamurella antarctica]
MTATTTAEALLVKGYRQCAKLTYAYGTTYFWGAALLPKPSRKHVYAVYALCRLADDIVDDQEAIDSATPEILGARLQGFVDRFWAALDGGECTDPVLAAVVNTVRATEIDPECFHRFFGAMAMDLHTTSYLTWDDLLGYMEGSAAVIGEMMLPVLQPLSPAAREPARSLGFAFQLTNFLRDVNEDLDRGRIYVPLEDIEHFGVDIHSRKSDEAWKALLAFELRRNRELYQHADTGLVHLPPRSAKCVGAARVLYSQILDRIEKADYDVFSTRVRVPTWRKATTAGRILLRGMS